MDERPNTPCCLFASDEELETDSAQFQCDQCAVAEALDGLWPENRRAWALSRRVLTRFTFETGCVALALERLTSECDPEDWADLLTRLAIIYDEVNPVPTAPADE